MKSSNISPQLVIEIVSQPAPTAPVKHRIDPIDLVPAGLAAFVAIVSWIVAERFARARERRTDMRELIKAFGASIDDVTAAAHEFYRLPGTDPRAKMLATSIRAKLGSLPRLLEAMVATGVAIPVDHQVRLFRQSVTGGAFDEAARPAFAEGDEIYPQITSAGRDLATEVQVSFFNELLAHRWFLSWRFR